jgi:tRNA (guanine37-N1)-methyltransferase
MVLKPEPIFRAVETLLTDGTAVEQGKRIAVVLLSPQGQVFDQTKASAFAAGCSRMILICGRYEGVDERVAQAIVTDEISVGDYVLTGGEIPAMVVVDAVTRLLPNALGSETSAIHDSFVAESAEFGGLLDFPNYTRPADFRGMRVPEVLVSGHHGEVAKWRRRAALLKTMKMRPDLLEKANLTSEERQWLDQFRGIYPDGI